jgi:hypothetical protein
MVKEEYQVLIAIGTEIFSLCKLIQKGRVPDNGTLVPIEIDGEPVKKYMS